MDASKFRSLFDLSGRVAIVTGGTRGIGRAIAEGLVLAGASVVVASRKAEACTETESALKELGGQALAIPVHMGNVDALEALVARAVERFGQLDIVVNNAANGMTQPIAGITLDAWDKSYAVNLRGPVFLVQKALPGGGASADQVIPSPADQGGPPDVSPVDEGPGGI